MPTAVSLSGGITDLVRPKQYKDKFRSWGWQKNLPAETAQFMVAKAKERKRAPPYKDTVFEFGGMCWTRERAEATVKRAKKALPEVMGESRSLRYLDGMLTKPRPANSERRYLSDACLNRPYISRGGSHTS